MKFNRSKMVTFVAAFVAIVLVCIAVLGFSPGHGKYATADATTLVAATAAAVALRGKKKTEAELAESRTKLLDGVRAIQEAAAKREEGKRELTADESKAVDAALDEAEALRGDIEAARAVARRKSRLDTESQWGDKPQTRQTDPTAPEDRGDGRDVEIRVHEHFRADGELRAFKSKADAYRAGMWCLANVFGNADCRQWCADNGVQTQRALNGVSNTAGAILTPDAMQMAIIWNVEERGVFAKYAQRVPMSVDTLLWPKSTGEITVYALGENQTAEVTESEPTFGSFEMAARTWGSLTRISRNLADDAVISIAEHLSQKIGYAHADKQDQAGFNGDGTSTYNGITGIWTKINDGNHAGSIVTATALTTYATLTLPFFEQVVGSVPQWADMDLAWYMSKPAYFNSAQRLMDAAGGNTKADVASGAQYQFLGYPVRFSQVLTKSAGTTATIAALFGSLKQAAALGVRKEVSVETLREKYATYNQLGVLSFARWGINAYELGDATNAGAMVALKFG
jgi:HK97 family phage major capsid protein